MSKYHFDLGFKDAELYTAEKNKDVKVKSIQNQKLNFKVSLPNQPQVNIYEVLLSSSLFILLLIYLLIVFFRWWELNFVE